MSQIGTLRLGILGAGGMGMVHAREILARPDATLAALCDVDDAVLERAAGRLYGANAPSEGQVQRYTSYAQMLDEGRLDAVVIGTPHTQHTEHIRACLEAGKHVLCEKPMATTAADARAAIELAVRQGVTLAIAYQRHGQSL